MRRSRRARHKKGRRTRRGVPMSKGMMWIALCAVIGLIILLAGLAPAQDQNTNTNTGASMNSNMNGNAKHKSRHDNANSNMNANMDKLSKLSGAEFDRAYMSMMVKDHKKDVKEFQDEANKGQDTDVKGFASTTLPTLQEHLRMAEDVNSRTSAKPSNASASTSRNM